MKLSEISQTLRDIRVAPIKTLGQNFLHDQNLARWIIQKAGISPGDFVVEIGPGLGAITAPALATGARVLAIEKDARLADFLRERFAGAALEVLHEDALKFDPRTLFARGPVKLIGNLPYYAATPILFHFLKVPNPIQLALFMLQKEVASRISATPGSKDYGVLTLTLQSRYRAELLRSVPANLFLPAPEVESALVRLTPRLPNELPDHDFEILNLLVRRGFSQRRKQLAKLLKESFPDPSDTLAKIGAAPQARAEELSLEQWIALANQIAPPDAKTAGNDPAEAFAVVDENDRVIAAKPRAEVHGNNLRHRAVHLFIFNPAGELLLQKRSAAKDRHPHLWDSSAAGHVAAGEDYAQTAARELEEELGIATALEAIAKIPASPKTGEEFIWLYRGEYDGALRPARSEIEAVKFFPCTLIDEWTAARPEDFAPGFLECWKVYRADETRRLTSPA
ncbi:MAG TPA: 16S rRNA (adenine(1518)-N(6)/adenine(1519)-N(6))-dimethyltransferase RsmA [Chthoniobacterales bacterium]